jgi:hypothetical protein
MNEARGAVRQALTEAQMRGWVLTPQPQVATSGYGDYRSWRAHEREPFLVVVGDGIILLESP